MIYVASYCRVSTDKDDQSNSFESQQRYFKEYIDCQPERELYRVYDHQLAKLQSDLQAVPESGSI